MSWLRPFIPARDFDQSIAFYLALGFTQTHRDETIAIFERDRCGFLLQNLWVREWAENCMLQYFVDDLDEWWLRVADLPARFGIPQPKAPAPQPWGIRAGFLTDPSGVLWQVSEP